MGINPGLRSGAVGHHFAGNGNPFWRLLHAARLTPVLIDYSEDQRLAEFGIALTNLCPRTTRTAAELTRAEIARGHVVLERKIAAWRPAVVALVGVSLYRTYFGVAAGPGPARSARRSPGRASSWSRTRAGSTPAFPGSSSKLIWFKRLRLFVDRVGARQTRPQDGGRNRLTEAP